MAISKTDFKRAFREVVSAEFAHIPTDENSIDFTFSERFLKRMNKLIKSQKKACYGLINTVYKRVAIICVLILMMFTAACSVKEIREPIIDFIKQVYETFTHYSFEGDTAEIITREYTVKAPKGFEQTNKMESDVLISTEYTNEAGDLIEFSQMTAEYSTGYFVDNEHQNIEKLTISDIEVELKEWEDTKTAIWSKDEYVFVIDTYGNVDVDTIKQMIQTLE